jgi:hypothetical protein
MNHFTRFILFIFFIAVALIACKSFEISNELISKSDIALREEIKNSNSEDTIAFSAVCEKNISEQQIETIKKIGITINTTAGNIITCRGNRQQIEELSKLSFITRMEKSKEHQTN